MASASLKNLRVPAGLWLQLLPFQREGVEYVIEKEGRALIADQMGLGKTVQAIAASLQYRANWPCLVICPSSLRYNWRDEYLKWTDIKPEDIAIVMTGKQACDKQLNIISYDLARAKADELKKQHFDMIIMDESHAIKSRKSKRTKALAPLLKKTKRLLLLSGTPALNRVEEIFTQLHVLQPKTWPSFHTFGLRYCNGKQGPFGFDYSGASNLEELFEKMSDSVMIRRHKDDVLKDLPPKRRQRILIQSTPKAQKMINSFEQLLGEQRNLEGSIAQNKRDELLRIDAQDEHAEDRQASVEKKALQNAKRINYEFKAKFMQLYREVCVVKIPAILHYIQDQLESDTGPFLVFAHHQVVLDAVQQYLEKRKVSFIRIDGKTDPRKRQDLVNAFQDDAKGIRVALLSITAAGVGLTLTRANLVSFVELFFTPGALLQAEDRAHRIGQTADFVMIHYLVGEKTVEEVLWKIIERKLRELSMLLDGKTEAEVNEKQSQWDLEETDGTEHSHLQLLDTRASEDNNGSSTSIWSDIMEGVHETLRLKQVAAKQRKLEKQSLMRERRSDKRKRDQLVDVQKKLETRDADEKKKKKQRQNTVATTTGGKAKLVTPAVVVDHVHPSPQMHSANPNISPITGQPYRWVGRFDNLDVTNAVANGILGPGQERRGIVTRDTLMNHPEKLRWPKRERVYKGV